MDFLQSLLLLLKDVGSISGDAVEGSVLVNRVESLVLTQSCQKDFALLTHLVFRMRESQRVERRSAGRHLTHLILLVVLLRSGVVVAVGKGVGSIHRPEVVVAVVHVELAERVVLIGLQLLLVVSLVLRLGVRLHVELQSQQAS